MRAIVAFELARPSFLFVPFYRVLFLFVSAWRLMQRVRFLLRQDGRPFLFIYLFIFAAVVPLILALSIRLALLAFRVAARAGIVKERVG